MFSFLGRTGWPTCSWNDYAHASVTRSTWLCKSYKNRYILWHAFTPKGRKTCWKILTSMNRTTFCDTHLKSRNSISLLAQQVCDLLPCPFSCWYFPTVSSFTPRLHSYAILITPVISVSSSYIPLLEQSIFPFEFSIFCGSVWPFLPLHMVCMPDSIPDTLCIIPSSDEAWYSALFHIRLD